MASNPLIVVLLLSIVGSSFSAPLHPSEKHACDIVCPTLDLQRKGFIPRKSYHFSYEGKSNLNVDFVSPEVGTSMDLQAEVVLTLGPSCNLEVEIRDPKINGKSDSLLKKMLSGKRMMATYIDGSIGRVCADLDDHPSGLNFKKGILSAIQNSLPHLSHDIHNVTLLEVDVLGRCPTQYSVDKEDDHTVVTKEKDQKNCLKQFATADESPVSSWWLRSSRLSPVSESRAECRQVYDKTTQELKEVSCKDSKVVRIGEKSITTVQENTLKLIRSENNDVKSMDNIRVTDLRFEVMPEPKSEDVLPAIKKHMKLLCESVEPKVKEDAATDVQELISYLRSAPEDNIKELLKEIRKGEFCQKHERLESLYLDMVAYVDNEGAVDVMVDEVVNKKVGGARTSLYALSLHLQKKPCLHTIKAVAPLFESKDVPSSMVLAAGNVVRKYCKFHNQCLNDEPVKEILEKISKRLDAECSSTKEQHEKKIEVLTVLKSVGNIANISSHLEKSILKCLESKQTETFVRVSAAQAYRHSSCRAQPTEKLIKLAVKHDEETEVRIASYVAAIRCANYDQAKELISHIEREPNTQVRSFILSHLHNMQRSEAPYLRGLQYNLTTLLIPTDYEKDLRKFSRDIDLSYYSQVLGVGAGVESSVIYSPGSYVPRQLQTNLTLDLFESIINVGEFAVRLEDLDHIMSIIFGPGGFLEGSQHSKWAKELMKQLGSKGQEVKDQYERYLRRSGRKSDLTIDNILADLNDQEGHERKPRVDLLARIFGQEVSFTSLEPDFSKLTPNEILKEIFKFVDQKMLDFSNLKSSSARAAQLRADYFVPTVQGIPLQFKALLTSVGALDVDNSNRGSDKNVKLSPSASFAANIFVGYSVGAKSGLRMRSRAQWNAHSNLQFNFAEQKFEGVLDIPHAVEAFSGNYSCYTMNKLPDQKDRREQPHSDYPVNKIDHCESYKASLGIEVCIHAKYPKYNQVHMFPLGDGEVKVQVKKIEPNKELLKLKGSAQFEDQIKSLDFQLQAPGASQPDKMELTLEYKDNAETSTVMAFGKVGSRARSFQVNMKSKETPSGVLKNYVVFLGKKKQISTADQILMVKTKQGRKDNSNEFYLSTLKNLKKHVNLNIEVDIARSGRHADIRKMEANMDIPEVFKSVNYIRKLPNSSPSEVNLEMYSSMATPIEEVSKITGTFQMKGEVADMNQKCETKLKINIYKNEFDFDHKFIWTREKKQALLDLHQSKPEKRTIVHIQGLLTEDSNSKNSALAEIEIPALIPSFQAKGSADGTSEKYEVNLVCKKDNEEVFKVKGPVSVELSQSNFRQRSELTIDTLSNQEYLIKSRLSLSPKRQDALFDLTYNSVPQIRAEVELESDNSQATSSIALYVPKMVDAKIKVERTLARLQVLVNGYLEPHASTSRKIQGLTSIDLDQKEIKGKLAYDLDRDPNKKIELTAKYDYNKERKYASVKGDFSLRDKSYKYSAETVLGAYSQDPSDKNLVKIRVLRPEGKEFIFETECTYNHGHPMKEIKYTILVQREANDVHKIDSHYRYDFHKAPVLMKLVGETKIESPAIKEVIISIDTDVDISETRHKGHGKLEIKGEKLSEPIQTHIEFNHDDKELMARGKLDLGSSSKLKVNGHTHWKRDEMRSIRDASADFSVDLDKDRNYNVKALKSVQKLVLDLYVNKKKILSLEQDSPEQNLWSARLTTPLRKSELQSKLTDDSMTLSYYPNLIKSQDKYEAKGHYRQSSSGLDAAVKLSHPGMKKDISFFTRNVGEDVHGGLTLDIFQNPEDKVKIRTMILKKKGHSYTMHAEIDVPKQSYTPIIEAELDLHNGSNRLAIQVKLPQYPKPEFVFIVDANKATEKSWTIFTKLKTPSDNVEMLSELRKHELVQCRGQTLNGTIVSEKLGSFDFKSAVCDPGYVEFGASRSSQNKIYMNKLGMKRPNAIKFAVDLVYDSASAITVKNARHMESTMNLYGEHVYLPKMHVLFVGAQLWRPTLLSLDAYYNDNNVQTYLNHYVRPAIQKMEQFINDVVRQIPEDFRQSVLPTLPEVAVQLAQEVQHLKEKLSEEVSVILKEMGITSETFKELQDAVLKAYQKLYHAYKIVYDGIDVAFMNAFQISIKDIIKWVEEKDQEIQKDFIEFLNAIFHMFTDPQRLMQHRIVKWASSQMVGSSIWDWIKEKFERMKHKIERDFKEVEHFVIHYAHVLRDEARRLYEDVKQFPVVKRFLKWVESFFEDDNDDPFERKSLIGFIESRFYSFNLSPTTKFVRVQVPIKRPVSSLSAAVSDAGLTWHSKQGLKHKSSATVEAIFRSHGSAKIEKGTLVTFDGLAMPVIFSDCELLLAKVFDDKVTAKIPNDKRMDLRIQTKSGQEVKVQLEKGKRPHASLLKEKDFVKMSEVTLRKASDSKIEIELKGMKIVVEDDRLEVKAKPLSFSKVEGLMGNHDNEKGNDARMGAEVEYLPMHGHPHHLTKKEARELMEVYRIYKTCQLPKQ